MKDVNIKWNLPQIDNFSQFGASISFPVRLQ
jgi:hypothetical protein